MSTFDAPTSKTIPLYIDGKDLRPITASQERGATLSGSNTIVQRFRGSDGPYDTLETTNLSGTPKDIVYTNSWFVPVDTRVAISKDTVNWRYVESGSSTDLIGVTTNGVDTVAVFGDSFIGKSTDLSTFQQCGISVTDLEVRCADYGNGVWLFYAIDKNNGDAYILRNTSNDLDDSSWDVETLGDIVCTSIAYGNGTWVATTDDQTIYSTSDGSVWFLSNTSNIENHLVRFANNSFVIFGNPISNVNAFSVKYSSDGIDWTVSTITGMSGLTSPRFADGEYGDGKWYLMCSKPSGRLYYSNTSSPSSFYYVQTSVTNPVAMSYGDGKWAFVTNTSVFTIDETPKYPTSILDYGSNPIGSFTDTHFDSTGSLVSEVTELYQYKDSDINYELYFGTDESVSEWQPMFIGADSFGDLYEMGESDAIRLASRFATNHYLNEYPGSFRLEPTIGIDSEEWEYWIKDVFVDKRDSASEVGYSIVRRNYDSNFTSYDNLIKLVGPNSPIPPPTSASEIGIGYQEFSSDVDNTIRQMIFLAHTELGVGDVMLLTEPEKPTEPPYNQTGGWLKKGTASDTRETFAGSQVYESINRYTLWVRVTDEDIGEVNYVDSDYFTPEGIDSGYVYP